MKETIRNCLTTTGLSLLLLSLVATLYNARFLCVATVFQAGAASAVIHIGLTAMKRFESNFFLVETALEISYILLALTLFGFLFGWYDSTPFGVLMGIGIAVYVIGCLIDVFRIRSDVEIINRQLRLRDGEGD